MSVRPLGNRVIVKRCKAESVSAGGIIIPDNAKQKSIEGEVVAVGPGKYLPSGRRVEPTVKVGDRVLFAKHAGSDVKLSGDEQLFLTEDDILAVVG